jgi:peptide/nickel transport system substrate-binding protein
MTARLGPLPRSLALAFVLSIVILSSLSGSAFAAPEGQMTWAVHVSIAPLWFDPAETPGIITPYMFLYALHDAVLKPMPGNPYAPSLAESWSESKDGRTYEFVLRKGVKFHNGDPVTAEDVKFSVERYRGASAKPFKDRIAAVETPDPGRVRFRLKEPWPDFITFYTNTTGAGWIVPKKYVEKVGDDGFKKAPVGAGPYKFVSFTPGVELVMLEANEQYWRKTPSVKRIVFKVITDDATRLAALKRGEIDIAYSTRGELGEEVQRTPGLRLAALVLPANQCLVFTEQWSPKSPWADRRVRLAANLAFDRTAINQAETLGKSRMTGSMIPQEFEFAWKVEPHPFDPAKAKQLLAEAGYPNGFEGGEYFMDSAYSSVGEAVANYWKAAGIKVQLRPLERAAFFAQYREKKLRGVIQSGTAAFGNAATRIEAFVHSNGIYAYGGYPDIDGLFAEQAAELDKKKREAVLVKIQQLMHEKVMYAPIWELGWLNGVGPRVVESGLGLIPMHAYSAPYEDLKLKGK